ncbi:uncharacterized protein V1518DRAFT_409722 [Limtongia smithiae]|uniref:uncharacterized protein n=1 Tax=Limtongia smithiae TaxID=1125753 RepID=UPI0034CE3381
MTRGNQREKDREKANKKAASQKKKLEGDPRKRQEEQAAIMRAKQREGEYISMGEFGYEQRAVGTTSLLYL